MGTITIGKFEFEQRFSAYMATVHMGDCTWYLHLNQLEDEWELSVALWGPGKDMDHRDVWLAEWVDLGTHATPEQCLQALHARVTAGTVNNKHQLIKLLDIR